MAKCCEPVYWKHEDGWDIYNKSDCYLINGHYVPRWFDNFIVEDLPTKKAAMQEVKDRHVLGVCLVR